jgi:DNA-binding MurR/RpiR family transcriptional regulator
MSLSEDLRSKFNDLSPALQQVATYVLQHPNEVVTSSMRTIGRHADSTPTTLVRFAQHFGFEGWPDLKQALQAELGLNSEAYGLRAKTLIGRAKDHTLVGEMFEVQRENLDITHRQIEAALLRACELIEKAPAVHAIGWRACFPIAFSFVYVYRMFRREVHLLDGQGGSLEMQQRAMSKGDTLVAVTFAPYSRETLEVAQAAKAAGCHVLALTDGPTSPLAMLANEVLLFSTESPSFFPSIAAGVSVVESLVELLASRAGSGVVKKVNQVERQLFESGAYLQPPRVRRS